MPKKQSAVVARSRSLRRVNNSDHTKLDLYNFDTSEECRHLEFSNDKENSSSDKTVKALSKRKCNYLNVSSYSLEKAKRLKVDGSKSSRPAPTFQFFSTKINKNRCSDSGIFMTPSPLLDKSNHVENNSMRSRGASLPKNKSASVSTVEKGKKNTKGDCMPDTNAHKINVQKGKPGGIDSGQQKSIKEPKLNDYEIKTSKKMNVNQVVESNTIKRRYSRIKSDSSSQLRVDTMTKKSVSDEGSKSTFAKIKKRPCLESKKESKTQATNTMFTDTRKKPTNVRKTTNKINVGHVNIKTVGKLTSGLGRKATSTPSGPSLGRSRAATNQARIRERDALASPPEVSPVQKMHSPSNVDALLTSPDLCGSPSFQADASLDCGASLQRRTVSNKVIAKVQTGVVKQDAKAAENQDLYNSLMDGSIFDPGSPAKKDRSVSQGSEQSDEKPTCDFTIETTQRSSKSETSEPNNSQSSVSGKTASVTERSGHKYPSSSISVKKKGRYSTSRIEAWACVVNEQFEDIESYELSVE